MRTAFFEADDFERWWLAGMSRNARIIAAAPELLAALERARIALTFYREEMARDVSGKDYPFGIDCENEVRAIVAKAKGENHE